MSTLARGLLFCVLLSSAAAPPPAQAQKVWRLGVLTVLDRSGPSPALEAFLREMRQLGYREGENLVIEWRHTAAGQERRRKEAALLMAWKPDVVFTVSGINARALRDADSAVPIVVGAGGDLVGMRLAATLSRPGGSITGLQILSPDLAAKRLQLLKEILPKLQRVALLHAVAQQDQNFYDRIFADLQTAAASQAVRVQRFAVGRASDLERSFAEMGASKAEAVMIVASPFMSVNQPRVIALAAQSGIPAMFEIAGAVDAGGLVAYGPRVEELFRRGAHYVDRILKGTNPAAMPIEQPTTFELVVNRRTAGALGLKIPPGLIARTDRVVD